MLPLQATLATLTDFFVSKFLNLPFVHFILTSVVSFLPFGRATPLMTVSDPLVLWQKIPTSPPSPDKTAYVVSIFEKILFYMEIIGIPISSVLLSRE